MYNQVVKSLTREIKRETEQATLERFFHHTIKPKPKYFPKFLWVWLASFFIRL